MRSHPARHLWLMTLLLIVLTLLATTLGAMRLPLTSLLPAGDEILRNIWLTIRLPRVLLALLVGAALALSGCVMQGLFRNPLADPGLLGISGGAALAVACWLVLPLSVPPLVTIPAGVASVTCPACMRSSAIARISPSKRVALGHMSRWRAFWWANSPKTSERKS